MKNKGRRTIIENLDVEVDVLSFLEKYMMNQFHVDWAI